MCDLYINHLKLDVLNHCCPLGAFSIKHVCVMWVGGGGVGGGSVVGVAGRHKMSEKVIPLSACPHKTGGV